jgi:hypothetical protein
MGGCTPSPRKDSADSSNTMLEKFKVSSTMMGAVIFGRIWMTAIRQVEAPKARLASMNGSVFSPVHGK